MASFRWWSITGIRADGDELVLEVASVSAKFPARHFNASLERQRQVPLKSHTVEEIREVR
jgi:hypothetical protein